MTPSITAEGDTLVQKRRLPMSDSSLLGQRRREVADNSVDSRSEVDHLVALGFVGFDRCVDLADRRFPSEFGVKTFGHCSEGLKS